MKDASLWWERWHPVLLPASSGTMHRDGTGWDRTDLGQEQHRLHRSSWGLCPAPFSPRQRAAQGAEETTPWWGHHRYCTFILFLGASMSCHGASGSVRSLMPPQHGLNWRHLKASTESANEIGADSSATLPPHPFSTRTLHPSHGHRPSPARTELGTCPLLPRAPSTLLAPLARCSAASFPKQPGVSTALPLPALLAHTPKPHEQLDSLKHFPVFSMQISLLFPCKEGWQPFPELLPGELPHAAQHRCGDASRAPRCQLRKQKRKFPFAEPAKQRDSKWICRAAPRSPAKEPSCVPPTRQLS